MSYKEFAQKYNLTEGYFPHADKGVLKFEKMYGKFKTMIAFIVISVVMLTISHYLSIEVDVPKTPIKIEQKENADLLDEAIYQFKTDTSHYRNFTPTIDGKSLSGMDYFKYCVHVILFWIGYVFRVLSILVGLFFIVRLVPYVLNVFKRQRMYEREVIMNDYRAYSLKHDLLKQRNIKERYAEFKRKMEDDRNREKDSDSKSKGMSVSDKSTQLMYETLIKKLKVNVNTREETSRLEQPIVRTYIITVELPMLDEAQKMLVSEVEHLNETANRILKNDVKFGEYLYSSDNRFIQFTAKKTMDDPYFYDLSVMKGDDYVVYESVYALNIFNDETSNIEKKQREATTWTAKTRDILGKYLTTNKINVNFVRAESVGSNGQFIYAFSEGSKIPAIKKMNEELDVLFNKRGTSCSISGDKLSIVIPLPDELKTLIDVSSMYRPTFGGYEEIIFEGDKT